MDNKQIYIREIKKNKQIGNETKKEFTKLDPEILSEKLHAAKNLEEISSFINMLRIVKYKQLNRILEKLDQDQVVETEKNKNKTKLKDLRSYYK